MLLDTVFPAFLWRARSQSSFLPSNHAETQMQHLPPDEKDDQGASNEFGCFHTVHAKQLMPSPTNGGQLGVGGRSHPETSQGFSHVPAVTPDGTMENSGSPRSSC